MNESLTVGRVDGMSEDLDKHCGAVRTQGSAVEVLFETAASTVFETEERQGVALGRAPLADLMDLDDVRVLHLADGLGLAAEAGPAGLIGVRPGQDHLEGDGTV